ncbi:hypothetical protein [Actinacidiphila sp. bgisy160]|uniref:hypothetical protein n=1 Tax=Actinacidiphila sp. bgisy160 TaxID=3413796 RepID=UPI003D763640
MTKKKPVRKGLAVCAICRKPTGGQRTAKAASGKTCHERCLQQAKNAGTRSTAPAPVVRTWDTRAAEREFARNKGQVDSGETFRGQARSTWRVGGTPSSAGEIGRSR